MGIMCDAIIMHYLAAHMDKKRISDAFKKYVAPQVVDEVAKQGNYELKLGGQKKDIAVLFVDIRGFTPMSESLQPEQVVEILNEYLALTTGAIFKNGGTLALYVDEARSSTLTDTYNFVIYSDVRAVSVEEGVTGIKVCCIFFCCDVFVEFS